ncbi:hypothetical protein AVEN_57518-1 [Araneus ventricosus]|uniref:Uncharacterized protein n=1 Tax=Araneus ventricosus TaxID=182803 RepID=A0A4Y2W4E8_ARAVE|nr:hypothetical protein AVEN_57518-1 [Araneus ventricosus]
MSPKKKPQEDGHKRRKRTVEIKRKIIEKRERGVSLTDLARTYNRYTSAISTILKDKDRVKEIDASNRVKKISAKRLRIFDNGDRLLLIRINEKQLQRDSVNENIIFEKAKVIFADFVKKTPGLSIAEEVLAVAGSKSLKEELASTAL